MSGEDARAERERPTTGDPLLDEVIDEFVESEYLRAIEEVRKRVEALIAAEEQGNE